MFSFSRGNHIMMPYRGKFSRTYSPSLHYIFICSLFLILTITKTESVTPFILPFCLEATTITTYATLDLRHGTYNWEMIEIFLLYYVWNFALIALLHWRSNWDHTAGGRGVILNNMVGYIHFHVYEWKWKLGCVKKIENTQEFLLV